jgi:hypothetical protein
VIVGVVADAAGRQTAEDPTRSTRRRTASFLTIAIYLDLVYISVAGEHNTVADERDFLKR